jgi:ribosomal protein S18 acetylase RimI-like enzyme
MLAGSMVTLEPMSDEAWIAWREASIRGYAQDKVRVGSWPAEAAEARAANEFASLLSAGASTPGRELRSITRADGVPVGAIWVGPDPSGDRRAAWVWDIVIDEAFRGQGYGRAAMLLLEPLARDMGYEMIRLHVFGDNDVARGLYRSVGDAEEDVVMIKRLT